ncbi:unnamed protein product [Clonostachys byssicola]|uniref:Uncharacterized protein n=1 Tax=Clonostachys byssicola TaxID=160290 RepID=A0A9N9UDB4_9HYPO|nr:unnamed protein product [Clonostachys byssicola]
MHAKFILTTLLSAASIQAAPLQKRAVVDHDSLSPLPEAVQSGTLGELMLKFEPRLYVSHGCQSYPAVDSAGNVSGGLSASGSASGACRDESKGQTYARAAEYNGRIAIMYAWYMPKDHPDSAFTSGHRHDWENAVVFVNKATGAFEEAFASAHGKYSRSTSPAMDGNHVLIEYYFTWPLNHATKFTSTVGRDLPVLDWATMTSAMQNALNTYDFGSAEFPAKDSNFVSNLDKASSS